MQFKKEKKKRQLGSIEVSVHVAAISA